MSVFAAFIGPIHSRVTRGVSKGGARGVKRANRARPEWDEREHEVLEADFVITLSDGTRSPCARSAPIRQKYEEKHCADPIEGPNTAPSTATILHQRQGRAVDLQPRARRDHRLLARGARADRPVAPVRHDDA